MNNKDRNVIESLTSVMMDIKKAIELIDQKIDKLNYAIESLNTTEAVVASKVVLDSPKNLTLITMIGETLKKKMSQLKKFTR